MHTQAKFRPCGSLFSICAFSPSFIIMRVCATIWVAYTYLCVFLLQTHNSNTTPRKLQRCFIRCGWKWCFHWRCKGRRSASSLSRCFPSSRKCVSLWKTEKPPYVRSHRWRGIIRSLTSSVSTPSVGHTIRKPQTAEPRRLFFSFFPSRFEETYKLFSEPRDSAASVETILLLLFPIDFIYIIINLLALYSFSLL